MSPSSDTCEVLVVGGGPVGLLLGALLAKQGVDVRVAERRSSGTGRSRAIGVHPPGLACLARVGLADALVEAGVRVRRGRALRGRQMLAAIDFSVLRGPFDFVLSVPQSTTEQLLEQRLGQLAAHALMRGVEAEHFAPGPDFVQVTLADACGTRSLRARFVVGCDGRRSAVRRALGGGYRGRVYPQRFAMSDLPDSTAFGAEAVVFVSQDGLVESFPLPHARRRWVASLGREAEPLSVEGFVRLLEARTDQALRASPGAELSAFSAESFCAQRWVSGRLVLAGDAAHVVSPIGGQGMNLGWLDACALADTLPLCLAQPARAGQLLAAYAQARRKASRRAARRAELYMTLGFAAPLGLRTLGLRALGSEHLARRAARLFTMEGL